MNYRPFVYDIIISGSNIKNGLFDFCFFFIIQEL